MFSLEARPSDDYPQHMFLWRNKKTSLYFFIVYASHILIRLICIRGSHRCANVMKSTCTAAVGSKPSLCFSQRILLNRSKHAKAKIRCANAHDYTCICFLFRLRPDEPFLITWVNMQLTFITVTILFSFFPENRL